MIGTRNTDKFNCAVNVWFWGLLLSVTIGVVKAAIFMSSEKKNQLPMFVSLWQFIFAFGLCYQFGNS